MLLKGTCLDMDMGIRIKSSSIFGFFFSLIIASNTDTMMF